MVGRILGIDYGEKRIGLALSDPLGMTAQPKGFLNAATFFLEIPEKIKEWAVAEIVVGLPKNMNGTDGPSAEKARALAHQLAGLTGLKINFVDERLTTREAERVMIDAGVRRADRKQLIDQSAAVLILQTHLDKISRKS